jgi:hypothetical protein
MAYIETLLSTYPQFSLSDIRGGKDAAKPLPLAAGLVLLEARACRLDPEHSISFVDRRIMQANAEVWAWYAERYDIIPTPPRPQPISVNP